MNSGLINQEFIQHANALIEAGKFFHDRGWVPATSGNLSAALHDGLAITVSGRHKGRLTRDDIMLTDVTGRSMDGKKCSAETLLHVYIYKNYRENRSVLHTHSPSATAISLLSGTEVALEGYELLKALSGIDTHATRVVIPVIANDQDIVRLAQSVDARLDKDSRGFLIKGHGLYTWGKTVEDAVRHVEALEAMFEIQLRLMALKRP
ncbi:methylthioribulose 1-phosphate dehydratase [Candidatus Methylospira mobilis]|uniref:methylthioribulose 1-phosphate dehydratase n=1 Tax=Candidatus Methylospira mobilis TaxID=1808979 RepID=UPI0028EF65D4|nr:methylthioribulose 1-phosphate dehydratase [Candidatus Methylospira mobilis]WNV03978.1 methylthioribulose 1-phosphate dehydratase [Candidatus Methylospira mobilis]